LIGRRVGQVGGYDYMQFIAPGLIMMTVITNSYGNVVFVVLRREIRQAPGGIAVSPLPNWLIVAGYMCGGILRGVLVGSVVTIVSLFFTRLALTHVFAVISAVLLTSMVFALGGFINALFAKISTRYPGSRPSCSRRSPTWAAYFIRSRCCRLAHIVSHANPILYMVSAFRYGFLGTSDVDLRLAYGIMVSAASGNVRTGRRAVEPRHGHRD